MADSHQFDLRCFKKGLLKEQPRKNTDETRKKTRMSAALPLHSSVFFLFFRGFQEPVRHTMILIDGSTEV
jgi:hypothetical protein